MILTRKLGIIALTIYTLFVTVLRAFRPPNDFAEAHWLLDYRYGFVKRGLIGEIFSLITGYLSIPVTAQLIFILATVAFLIYCVLIIALSLRIVQRSGWSTEAVVVSLVFLSSPFVVMSAHLVGYYDNIIIVLGIVSIALLLKGRPWLGACLQVPALLTHENSIILIFPLFCLAWLLVNSRRQKLGVPLLPFLPLLLPICTFLAIAASPKLFLDEDFVKSYTAHLSQFPFIQEKRNTIVPALIARSFLDYYATQSKVFADRISVAAMYGLILPTSLAILCFAARVYKIRNLSAEAFVLLGVCLAPQLMHLVAWDTGRIWTYTILCAYLALWIYSELVTPHEDSSTNRLLCFAALVTNVVILTPLMDHEADRYTLVARLILYAPVILGSLALILDEGNTSVVERLSIQGLGISKLLYPTNRSGISAPVHGVELETPEH